MYVQKFEADSLDEALKTIKRELGPDAIILSAKDIGTRFGIGGQNSVEVTAAVSETTLRKKHLAERKMNETDKKKFSQIPATRQKEFINKVFERIEKNKSPIAPEPPIPEKTICLMLVKLIGLRSDS